MPCMPNNSKRNPKYGDCEGKVPSSSSAQKKRLIKYLGEPDLTVVYNNERMDMNEFNDASIVRESRVMNR